MSIGRYWPNSLTTNLEKGLFMLTGAPIQGPKRVQGGRIFNFLVSLDWKLKNLTLLKISALGANCGPLEGFPNLKVQKRRPPVI